MQTKRSSPRAVLVMQGAVSKAPDWDSQDAFAADIEKGRFAVADGVTNGSFMSKQFAQRVAENFVGLRLDPCEYFLRRSRMAGSGAGSAASSPVTEEVVSTAFESKLRNSWRSEVERVWLGRASAFQRAQWESGELASHATLAGVCLKTAPDATLELRFLLVGDCFLFICVPGKVARVLTGSRPDGTGRTSTARVASHDAAEVIADHAAGAIPLGEEHGFLILATDYIGVRLARAIEAAGGQWLGVVSDLRRLRNQGDFALWVEMLRRADQRNEPADDATVALVRFNGVSRDAPVATPGPATAAPTTAEILALAKFAMPSPPQGAPADAPTAGSAVAAPPTNDAEVAAEPVRSDAVAEPKADVPGVSAGAAESVATSHAGSVEPTGGGHGDSPTSGGDAAVSAPEAGSSGAVRAPVAGPPAAPEVDVVAAPRPAAWPGVLDVLLIRAVLALSLVWLLRSFLSSK